MSGLLQIERWGIKAGRKPFMVEVPVDAEVAPYLVSSTQSFLWVEKAFNNPPCVRAAVRPSLIPLYLEIVEAVIKEGRSREWGNVMPFTPAGLLRLVSHLQEYGIQDVEVLVSAEQTPFSLDEGLAVTRCVWLPSNLALVVPKDRTFLGTAGMFPDGSVAVVVHNAPRGMGIAVGADYVLD